MGPTFIHLWSNFENITWLGGKNNNMTASGSMAINMAMSRVAHSEVSVID